MKVRRRDLGEPAASVAESWRRMEAWLDDHLPATRASLRPGIGRKDLAKFEAAIGQQLPDDVRESLAIHDGQGHIPDHLVVDSEPIGLIYGLRLYPLLDSRRSPTPSVLDEWRFWTEEFVEKAARGEDDGMLAEFSENCTSFPGGMIRCLHANRGWIPLGQSSDSNHLGIDLDPGPSGVAGQVINFGRDQEAKYVLAASWAHFLEDIADEWEAGNFVIDEDHPYGAFLPKEPRTYPFSTQYAAWSEAKLRPRRVGNGS